MTTPLEGKWRQVAATENGEVVDRGYEVILEMADSKFTVTRNGALEIEGTFAVDSDQNPTSIDWKDLFGADTGKVFKAFCVMKEDYFEFRAADEGLPRPMQIEAIQGHTVRRFERLRS